MTASTDPSVERALIEAARAGDAQAYERLVGPHRASLHAHCYRMLGSWQDAEDAAQEALLGAWQGLAGFEGRSSLRTWLFTIATHASLRLAARRSRRVLPVDHGPPAGPRDEIPEALESTLWVEPYPDLVMGVADGLASPEARYAQRESVELAFVAALQLLPGTQRAVLVLRDVLGFSAEEAAAALETSVASANSALQRARATIERRLPRESQRATRRMLGDERLERLLDQFVAAWARADVDAIVAMLAEDATFTMPPLPLWLRGRDDIRVFMAERVFALRWRFRATQASGQPTLAAYQWSDEVGAYRLNVLNVLTFRGEQVADLTAFLSPDVCGRFGLPDELPA